MVGEVVTLLKVTRKIPNLIVNLESHINKLVNKHIRSLQQEKLEISRKVEALYIMVLLIVNQSKN